MNYFKLKSICYPQFFSVATLCCVVQNHRTVLRQYAPSTFIFVLQLLKLTETKLHVHEPGKSLFKSFTPSSLSLYMEEKLTIIVESEDNDIEKLILNAAPGGILHKKVNTISFNLIRISSRKKHSHRFSCSCTFI